MTIRQELREHKETSQAVRRLEEVGAVLGSYLAQIVKSTRNNENGLITPETEQLLGSANREMQKRIEMILKQKRR